VVKVLRPGIEVLVETDLAAARLALRLLKFWSKVRLRVDLDRVGEEITETTRSELDLAAEGRNAEHFAKDFAKDARVRIPKVFWQQSARRTLTLENVGFIKIGDVAALEAAGIRRTEVARDLYRIYMQQIFVHHFVHSDPHPGNLFVCPLPVEGEAPFSPSDPVVAPPGGGPRPFQLVFVDFGMVAVIPERLWTALREYVIALATRDAKRLVQSYVAAGVLLPGADLRRLEEVHEELFTRFWGVSVGSLKDVAMSEARYFVGQYRDLIYALPFQVPVDLLFTGRAVGLLAGIATSLDPELDLWAETIPFGERLAAEELRRDWRGLLREGLLQLQVLLGLPRRLETFLNQAERGAITIETSLAPEAKKMVQRLERSVRQMAWMMISGGLLVAGAVLHGAGDVAGRFLMAASAVTFLWGLLSKR
jgi:predicted unusual protein kinase regulating ubiquinone biosynthesis (AarF/ABC1/UbiB family)